MTKVVIKKNKNNIPCFFKIEGHSGYAESGRDIVCASISLLAFTMINSMDEYTKDNIDYSVDEKTTCITIDLPTIRDDKASSELIVLAKTLYLGITQVKEEYGHKYISVKEEKLQC